MRLVVAAATAVAALAGTPGRGPFNVVGKRILDSDPLAGTPGRGPFNVVGKRIFDSSGQQVVFRGFSLSCTEYMARPGFAADVDDEESPNHPGAKAFEDAVRRSVLENMGPDGKPGGDWPGKFAWSCFNGAPYPNATFQMNNETEYIMNYLTPDTAGGKFLTHPTVKKVEFGGAYDEVVDQVSPAVIPIVRIPVTAGTWLYDIDASDIGAAGYRYLINMLVEFFTSRGVACIIDHHASCGGSKIGCQRGGPMALRNFGNYSGALAFWNNVSLTYKDNDLVLYELYNEPHVWYQALYGGDPTYAGYSDMYWAVRNNTPTGLILVGATNWSFDAAGPLAMWQQFKREFGAAWTNVMYVMHPYQGMFQGVWNSMRSTMRTVLALQTIGPVIWTELGQYCCNEGPYVPCKKTLPCNDPIHGNNFVENVINLAAQLDVSWTAWAWRGTNPNDGNCTTGETLCGYPDVRDVSPIDNTTGVLTSGLHGGANYTRVWELYVSPPSGIITVQDTGVLTPEGINVTAYEMAGFIPRPCIVPFFGQGGNCGWPLGTNQTTPNWVSLWNQSQGEAVLPGLPPSLSDGPLSQVCPQQACPGYTCSETSGVVPDPRPCGTGAAGGK